MTLLVIAALVKVSGVMTVAAAINVLLRRTSAASRHLVWTLAICGIVLLPVIAAVVPRWEIPIRVAGHTESAPVATRRVAPDETAAEPAGEPSLETAAASDMAPVSTVEAVPAIDAASQVSWPVVGLAVYLFGVCVLIVRLLIDRRIVRRLVRESTDVTDPAWLALFRDCQRRIGVNRDVRLVRSLEPTMPMALGSRRATILIPAVADTWSQDRRRAVLLHELAHVQRRDCVIQLLAAVACAAYWMHPGVWFVARRLRVERELACDDQVLAVGTTARDYAIHLLELAYTLGGSRSPALVVSMARPQQLEGRMLAILDVARSRTTPALRTRIAGLLVAAAVVVPLAAAETLVTTGPDETMVPPVSPVVIPDSTEDTTSPSLPSREQTSSRTSREIHLPGTWELRVSDRAGQVTLRLSERANSWHGRTIAIDELEGLSSSLLSESSSAGGTATFRIRRDAGTLTFAGSFRGGVGAGTFDFTPSTTFPAEMAKRGFASPTREEQYLLARSNIGFAYLDELNAQKYERPTLEDLVRAGDHGVGLEYLKGMSAAGYRFGQVATLVRTRDHGVTPGYIRGLAEAGFKNLTADELVRARDHGVSAEYAKAMRDAGFRSATLEELVRARDHGVSADLAQSMTSLGYERTSLDELINIRDHGVGSDYVKALADLGYEGLAVEDLVRARDHGVGVDFVKGLRGLGYRPTLDELVKARDHGVGVDFVKGIRDLGYDRVSINDLVRLRDHGVSLSYVRDQNSRSDGRLTVTELVRRRDRGR